MRSASRHRSKRGTSQRSTIHHASQGSDGLGFGAIVVSLPLGILADVAGRSSQKHLLAGIVLALGALLGGVVGWLAGAATSVIRRLRRRLTARGRREPAGA